MDKDQHHDDDDDSVVNSRSSSDEEDDEDVMDDDDDDDKDDLSGDDKSNDSSNIEEDSNIDDENDTDHRDDNRNDDDEDDEDNHSVTTTSEKTDDDPNKPATRKVHKLSLKVTEDFNQTLQRRGVLYVARIPPRMTPNKLKRLLSEYGTVTRIYLAEEDAAVRKRRRKLSGNGSKRYTEGWVEFERKRVAKRVARALNLTPISNHKRNPHYGDLWSLKYLSQFQWSHLTEKVAYERRVREQKLRLETMQARKETQVYKKMVETGKKLDKIEERKRKRAEREGMAASNDATTSDLEKRRRRAPQIQPVVDGGKQPSHSAILTSLV